MYVGVRRKLRIINGKYYCVYENKFYIGAHNFFLRRISVLFRDTILSLLTISLIHM